MSIIEITDAEFTPSVLESPDIVVIHFYAEVCKPCDDVHPILEAAAVKYDGKIIFTKLNTDLYRETVVTYGIRLLPTLLIFKAGKAVHSIVGSYLAEKLDSALAVVV